MKHKLIVPIITPFNEDETVNYAELKKLTRYLLDSGADGIYAGGSSAECFLLTEEERMKTLETIMDAADGSCVIAHVGNMGNMVSERLARHAERAGATALASVSPFYFNFSTQNIKDYFIDLAGATDLPLMIYYIPGLTHMKMSIDEFIKILKSNDNIASVKFTDSDYYIMQQIKSASGREIYSGRDGCFLPAISAGAEGAIGTTFNFMCGHYRKISEAYARGDMQEALRVQSLANNVIRKMEKYDIFNATKSILRGLGIAVGHARRPFKLTICKEEEKELLDCLIENTF